MKKKELNDGFKIIEIVSSSEKYFRTERDSP